MVATLYKILAKPSVYFVHCMSTFNPILSSSSSNMASEQSTTTANAADVSIRIFFQTLSQYLKSYHKFFLSGRVFWMSFPQK